MWVEYRLGLKTKSRGRSRTIAFAVDHVDFHARLDLLGVLVLLEPAAEIGGPRAQALDAHRAVVAEECAHRVAVVVHRHVDERVICAPRAARQHFKPRAHTQVRLAILHYVQQRLRAPARARVLYTFVHYSSM